jgi:extradiol dioxygenase family protein
MPRPFHLALPSGDIERTRRFYCDVLGCTEGRATETWIDLDFLGHQLVFHYCGGETLPQYFNPVDKDQVPLPHFGVVLEPTAFDELAARLTGQVTFVIPPTVRFAGTPGEQRTMFFTDPDGNALEFKSFADDLYLFAPFEAATDSTEEN